MGSRKVFRDDGLMVAVISLLRRWPRRLSTTTETRLAAGRVVPGTSQRRGI